MEELTVFSNNEFGEVRVVAIDGEPWFVGKDVSDILGYQNGSRDINRHVDNDDRQNYHFGSFESNRGLTIINESGLYSLILSSKLPNAKKFKRWVTSEVLPSIRKNGAYMTEQTLQRALEEPDFLIELATKLKQEKEKNKLLTVQNEIMKPKAEYFDDLVDRNTLTNFTDTAKEFKIKRKDFIDFLIKDNYIYHDKKGNLKPYADKNDGLFEVKEARNDKNKWSGTQTLITPKGRETFRLLLKLGKEE